MRIYFVVALSMIVCSSILHGQQTMVKPFFFVMKDAVVEALRCEYQRENFNLLGSEFDFRNISFEQFSCSQGECQFSGTYLGNFAGVDQHKEFYGAVSIDQNFLKLKFLRFRLGHGQRIATPQCAEHQYLLEFLQYQQYKYNDTTRYNLNAIKNAAWQSDLLKDRLQATQLWEEYAQWVSWDYGLYSSQHRSTLLDYIQRLQEIGHHQKAIALWQSWTNHHQNKKKAQYWIDYVLLAGMYAKIGEAYPHRHRIDSLFSKSQERHFENDNHELYPYLANYYRINSDFSKAQILYHWIDGFLKQKENYVYFIDYYDNRLALINALTESYSFQEAENQLIHLNKEYTEYLQQMSTEPRVSWQKFQQDFWRQKSSFESSRERIGLELQFWEVKLKYHLGDYREALKLGLKLRDFFHKNGFYYSVDFDCLLAKIQAKSDNPCDAVPDFERCFQNTFDQLQAAVRSGDEQSRLEAAALVESSAEETFGVLYSKIEDCPGFAGLLYNYALRSKGIALEQRRNIGSSSALSQRPDLQIRQKRLDDLYIQLLKNPSTPMLLQEIEALESTLNVEWNAAQNIDWKQIQRELNRDEVALEVLRVPWVRNGTWSYIALLLKPNTTHPLVFYLGAEVDLMHSFSVQSTPLPNYINDLYRSDPIPDENASTPNKSRANLLRISLNPVFSAMNETKKCYIAPAGYFNFMAFSAMFTSDGHKVDSLWEIHHLFSTRDLLKRKPEHFDLRGLLLWGGIDYGFGGALKPLTYSTVEVESIYRRVARLPSSKLLKGNLATEASILTAFQEFPRANVLHFATHGFQKSITGASSNPSLKASMTQSGLFFANANRVKPTQGINQKDAAWNAYEISLSSLEKIDLVVLSACETGLGQVAAGQEGVFGLPRAFRQAGAQRILVSLWPVADQATQILMDHFYQYLLAGDTAYEALRKAKMVVKGMEKYKAAYFWAGWVLME